MSYPNLTFRLSEIRYLLICFMLIISPAISIAHISFAAARVWDQDYFKYRNEALIRRAMLKANGKDWFMENIIYSDPKLLPFYLNFIVGGYCTAGEVYPDQTGKRDKFFDGLKNAIKELSDNNDTLYIFKEVKMYDVKSPLSGYIYRYQTREQDRYKHNYDFDHFDYDSRKYADYFSFIFEEGFSPRVCLNIADNKLMSKLYPTGIDNLIKKYRYIYNFFRLYTPPYNLITAPRDAEKMFEAIVTFDNYILSLNPKGRVKMKMLPWIYISGIDHYPMMNIKQLPQL